MKNFRKSIYRKSSSKNSFAYNFAQETNSTSVACSRTTYPITLYASVNFPVIGTQFYTDQELNNPFSFIPLTTFYYKRDIDGLLYPIFQDGKLVDNLQTCEGGGSTYSYRRDGSQEEGNPSFHIPWVDYISVTGTPQRIYLNMFTNDCSNFDALYIVHKEYAVDCND